MIPIIPPSGYFESKSRDASRSFASATHVKAFEQPN
jgi:hypothetical protein